MNPQYLILFVAIVIASASVLGVILNEFHEHSLPKLEESHPPVIEALDTIDCQNAISDWVDLVDRLDPIPEEIMIREKLLNQKNAATLQVLHKCDVKSLTVEELLQSMPVGKQK